MQSTLGKIKKITDLRSVWAHEEYDFSQWLAEEENLALLSDAVGIDIMLEELESAVGGFSVDLYASEEGTGRRIIIENQLEDTNHDHLGKIITYASGKDASVVIWIVKRALPVAAGGSTDAAWHIGKQHEGHGGLVEEEPRIRRQKRGRKSNPENEPRAGSCLMD